MRSAVRRLLPYVGRYRRDFFLGLAAALSSTAISLGSPWILKLAIDDLITGVTRGKLTAYASLLLGVALFGGFFRFKMRRIIVGASRDVEYDLRNDFLAALQRQSLSYFHRHRTGDLMSRATNDLSAVRMMIGPSVMYAVTTGVLFIVAVVMMLSLDVWLTLTAVALLPVVSIAVRYFGRAIHQRFELVQAQLSEMSAIAQESLAGVRVVRAYRQEPVELERFRAANDEYVSRNRAIIRLQGLFYPSLSFVLGLAAVLVLWQGSRAVIAGRLTLGEFVAFNAYLSMLSWPMIAFGWVTNLIQRGMASWGRMLEVLDAPPAIVDGGDAPAGWRPVGDIEFRHLSFRYGDRPVIDDVSFHVRAGQTVAIVGPTGSGKSTLLSLLTRLHDPPPGTLFVDGRDVRTLPLAVLRGLVGMAPQEPFLFSDTIAENVAFGAPPSMPEPDRRRRVVDVSGIARLDKDVESFPAGYDTFVGERGVTLSGGQRQRAALARALFPAPTILVLDDALSAVDTYTEEEILGRLRGVMRERTSIIVAHRISTVRDADLILVLDRGRIVERGTHDQLVAAGGFYAGLHRKQLLEEELAAS